MADNSIQLVHRPVAVIYALKLQNSYGVPYLDLLNWHVLDSPYTGRIYIQSQGNIGAIEQSGLNPGVIGLVDWGGSASIGANYRRPISYANGYYIRYQSGFQQAQEIPDSLRHAIALATAINLLDIQGDSILAGLSSISKSMDGMSESYSSTQSPTNAYYGARIGNYKKELEELLRELRGQYALAPILGF